MNTIAVVLNNTSTTVSKSTAGGDSTVTISGKVLNGTPGEWVASVAEREEGVASVSAPVHDAAGRVVAAVSVSGPIERLTKKPGQRYGALVAQAARQAESATH